MNKIHIKLIAMALALTLSVSVLIMSSYAWMVLSSSPAATGIQVIIGGGNTILIAPNVVTDEGYNIPGNFSDKMNFGGYGMDKSYGYLSSLAGLAPVSTSNGREWFVSGNKVDMFYENANLPKYVKDENGGQIPNKKVGEGNYIYLDFWVVSPSGNYDLRISTGDGTSDGGSFVIDLPEPKIETEGEITTGTLYQETGKSAAASVRIGFLANPILLEEEMQAYVNSVYNDDRFKSLRGFYREPDSGSFEIDSEKFTIYEPNGDFHPLDEKLDGSYVQTKPLMLENGAIKENPDIWNHLTVQLKSDWVLAGEQKLIEQVFNTNVIGNKELREADEKTLSDYFYRGILGGQFSTYVMKGEFISYSNDEGQNPLKNYVDTDGKVSASQINGLRQSGATEDVVIIELEQNVPQRIRMFIWLEGQDIDCPASANSARFAVNIELAGGTKE